MMLRPGSQVHSAVCATQVVVVRAPSGDVDLRCGGYPMIQPGGDKVAAEVAADYAGGTLLGKRYEELELGLEILCTRGGAGELSIGSAKLALKDAKPLPASD